MTKPDTTKALGIGLAGIRERLREVRGDMSAGNIRGGFRLVARIPIGRDA